MTMKRLFLSLLAVILAFSSLLIITPSHTKALMPNNIIDDPIFDRAGTMSAAQIDNWLNSKFGSTSCISTSHGFSAPDPTGYAPGTPVGVYSYSSTPVSAGQVIYDAAQAYGINPQVLLTTLEKEQSLVTGSTGCSVYGDSTAMGYGCPDGGGAHNYVYTNGTDAGTLPTPLFYLNNSPITAINGTCVNSASKAGFSEQVIHAAWLLAFGRQRSVGNTAWNVQLTNYPQPGDSWNNSDDPPTAYGGPMTQGLRATVNGGSPTYYDGYTTIDGQSVHMGSGGTAALYWYTPHLHGNQNFYDIFTNWFGSPDCDSTTNRNVNPGIYDPASGTFYERNCQTSGPANTTIQYGNPNWIPLSGDWNRDGIVTPGAYDPTTGRFYLRNSNDPGPADISFQYGNIGWTPITGDWDGNGYWSVGLYDPNTSTFYLKNLNGPGSADYTVAFGNNNWKPIAGDWDGNSTTTIGVYSPDTSTFYVRNSNSNGPASNTIQYGNAGWTPIAGDWDGNSFWSIGAYDPSASKFYLRNLNSSGPADITITYGNSGWSPLPGDWDGH